MPACTTSLARLHNFDAKTFHSSQPMMTLAISLQVEKALQLHLRLENITTRFQLSRKHVTCSICELKAISHFVPRLLFKRQESSSYGLEKRVHFRLQHEGRCDQCSDPKNLQDHMTSPSLSPGCILSIVTTGQTLV